MSSGFGNRFGSNLGHEFGGWVVPQPIVPDTAFSGLQFGWVGSAGKTLGGSDVNAWASTVGASAPVSMTGGIGGWSKPASGSNYVEFAAMNPDAETCGNLATGGAQVTSNSDAYFSCCMSVVSFAGPSPSFYAGFFKNLGATYDWVYFGLYDGTVHVGYARNDVVDTAVLAQVPASPGVYVLECWSDAARIYGRVNAGPIGSTTWSGTRWGSVYDGVDAGGFANADAADAVSGRLFELHATRGAYPGDANAAGWRSHCRQYGYSGA